MKVGKVRAGYKRSGRKIRLWMEVENWPHAEIKEVLGAERELVESVWGSYEEFKKRYPHLYSTEEEYILDDWDEDQGIFNLDFLADYGNDRTEDITTTKELEEKGLTIWDIKKAVEEFIEASKDIRDMLKNIREEKFERVIKLEFDD